MKWLIALLAAIGAVTAGVFFWRKNQNQESAGSMWDQAEDLASSLTKTAAEKAGEAAEKVKATADKATSAASDAADQVTGAAGSEAAEKVKATADKATSAASDAPAQVAPPVVRPLRRSSPKLKLRLTRPPAQPRTLPIRSQAPPVARRPTRRSRENQKSSRGGRHDQRLLTPTCCSPRSRWPSLPDPGSNALDRGGLRASSSWRPPGSGSSPVADRRLVSVARCSVAD